MMWRRCVVWCCALWLVGLSAGCDNEDSVPATTDPSDAADASDASDSTEPSDESDPTDQVVAAPVPLTFEACNESTGEEEACECSNAPGFQTYRAIQDGTERCFTVYGNPAWGTEPRPLLIEPDCYSSNGVPDNPVANDRYGYRSLHLTAPDGGWQFPQNGIVNQDNYWSQCDPSGSREIDYLATAFVLVDQLIEDGLVASDKVFMSGFSQNSMFSIFAATCFPDRVAGISQGGSGLFSAADGSVGLPKCEGVCSSESFETYGDDCVSQDPCGEACEFWPVYPVNEGDVIRSCLFMYDNDEAAHTTAYPGFKYLSQEGHQPSLHIFASDGESDLGGHRMPVLGFEWVNQCLGIFDECPSSCAADVVSQVEAFRSTYTSANPGQDPFFDRGARQQLIGTYMGAKSRVASCSINCAPTKDMLDSVEPASCFCAPDATDCPCRTLGVDEVPGSCMP